MLTGGKGGRKAERERGEGEKGEYQQLEI